MGCGRARLELGMELAGDKVGMLRQLHDLHELAIGRKAAEHQALLGHGLEVGLVEFEAVTVAFVVTSPSFGKKNA